MEKKLVNIDAKLAVNKFNVNEEDAHIEVNRDYPDKTELDRLVLICPAGLYKYDAEGILRFDYAGCLECGTCRVLSGDKALTKWEYPIGTFGILHREG